MFHFIFCLFILNLGLFCQMVVMPLLAYSFTPVVNDEAKSFAILIQVRET